MLNLKKFLLLFLIGVVVAVVIGLSQLFKGSTIQAVDNTWHSSLYPVNWSPGFQDSAGRYLQDYSYAGYHMGQSGVPGLPSDNQLPKPWYNVTQSPYLADKTGSVNAATAIQKAISDAKQHGGGTIYLPAGKYLINSPFLRIDASNIVIKGDGPDRTFLYTTDENLRLRKIIDVGQIINGSSFFWYQPVSTPISVAQNYLLPTKKLILSSTAGLNQDDWIIVYNPATKAFRQEHDSDLSWAASEKGPTFYRQIVNINRTTDTITLDIPTRYALLTRDNAQVYKVAPHIEEVGVQDLSFGIRQNHLPPSAGSNWSGQIENDYAIVGTAGYNVHGSKLILMHHVVNGWISNIGTYLPAENNFIGLNRTLEAYPKYPHIASKGINLDETRNVTIYKTSIGPPSYRGGGGNGYLYDISAGDNLLYQVTATNGRHNFLLTNMKSTGNVVLDSRTNQDLNSSEYVTGWHSDLHGRMPIANLFDNLTFNNDTYYAYYLPGSVAKGQNSTQTTFWNAIGIHANRSNFLNYADNIIWSTQYGWGYIIGTSGAQHQVKTTPTFFNDKAFGPVDTAPEDFTEGIGNGQNLVPRSLYFDQLSRRSGVTYLTPTPTLRLTNTPSPTATIYPTVTPTATNHPTLTPTPTKTPTPTLQPSTTPTPTLVTTATPSPGACNKSTDFNSDGLTDLSDASYIIAALGQSGDNLPEDLNCDQIVDLSDFSILVSKL